MNLPAHYKMRAFFPPSWEMCFDCGGPFKVRPVLKGRPLGPWYHRTCVILSMRRAEKESQER